MPLHCVTVFVCSGSHLSAGKMCLGTPGNWVTIIKTGDSGTLFDTSLGVYLSIDKLHDNNLSTDYGDCYKSEPVADPWVGLSIDLMNVSYVYILKSGDENTDCKHSILCNNQQKSNVIYRTI